MGFSLDARLLLIPHLINDIEYLKSLWSRSSKALWKLIPSTIKENQTPKCLWGPGPNPFLKNLPFMSLLIKIGAVRWGAIFIFFHKEVIMQALVFKHSSRKWIDLESALSSVWGYSNYIFCLPRGRPKQYSMLSYILHCSGEGALSTVFCTSALPWKKENSRFTGPEREKTTRNMAYIQRKRQHRSWSLLEFIPALYYWYIMANIAVDVGTGVPPAPSYQGSALAIGLLYKRELPSALVPAQTWGPSLLLFFHVCRSCSFSERESLNICFQERRTVHEFQVDLSKAPNPWGQVKMHSSQDVFHCPLSAVANFRHLLAKLFDFLIPFLREWECYQQPTQVAQVPSTEPWAPFYKTVCGHCWHCT